MTCKAGACLVIAYDEGGEERHPVTAAKWNLYASDRDAPGTETLYFHVVAAEGIANTSDIAQGQAPWWEVCVIEPSIDGDAIKPGARFEALLAYDPARGGHVTNLYYYEHESTARNVVAIEAVDGRRVRARLVGGLDPRSQLMSAEANRTGAARVSVTAWFEHDPMSLRQAC